MRRLTTILLFTYFWAGIIYFSFRDLSLLPKAYQHCKVTEDNNGMQVDFSTDVLIKNNCLFDEHQTLYNKKAHFPSQLNNMQEQLYLLTLQTKLEPAKFILQNLNQINYRDKLYCFCYIGNIFHPPAD